TSDDASFWMEQAQKAMGFSGDWTHIGMVDHDGRVLDILLTENTVRSWPLEFIFTDNCHARVLRPAYATPDHRERALSWARAQIGQVTYDWRFSLESDDALYCQEFVQKALRRGGIEVSAGNVYGLKEFVSADQFSEHPRIEERWSTGSNFWLNWLSKVT
ncbi:MAG: YiiX/YebB-like N1pC/P60 family cysteine hydrolase, partial [Candidatus Eremiobacterota bacterium]